MGGDGVEVGRGGSSCIEEASVDTMASKYVSEILNPHIRGNAFLIRDC